MEKMAMVSCMQKLEKLHGEKISSLSHWKLIECCSKLLKSCFKGTSLEALQKILNNKRMVSLTG